MAAPRKIESASKSEPTPLDIARFAPANRKRLSAPGLRTFLAVADLWRLNEEQRRLILGYPSRSTYHNWCRTARQHGQLTLDVDVLTRLSVVLGIHQALGILFKSEAEGLAWLREPHNAHIFAGRPPLDLIANGTHDGQLLVRRFLDAARGGIYMAPNAIDENFAPYSDSEIIFQ